MVPPTFCQMGLNRFVAICTWYGAIPPLQVNRRSVSCAETAAVMGAATVRFIVALANKPPASLALRLKLFTPALPASGVPESTPLTATFSHAGPLIFVNVSGSPFGSVALVAIVPEYGWPELAPGWLKGLAVNAGGTLVRTA